MESIWHIGIAVPDLEQGKKELGEVFGLRWRPARVRKLTLADAARRPYEVECHVAFSLGGPFAVETWQAIRTADWKYIHYVDLVDMDELYHLGDDPYEMKNLVHDPASAGQLEQLKKQLADLQEKAK